MADRNSPNRYPAREQHRGASDYEQQQQGYRQQEQFSTGNERSPEGYDPSYGQMGDSTYRDDFGQSDTRYDTGWDGNERYGPEGSGYARERGQLHRHRDHGYGPARYDTSGRSFSSFTSEDQGGRDFSAPTYRRGYGSYRERMDIDPAHPRYRRGQRGPAGDYTGSDGHRGWFERASDEVASWFGDEQAEHRREMDHRGRGPANYTRSNERLLEDACERLTDDRGIDARNISVTAKDNEVTLDGTVNTRWEKRRAEDCVHDISGVKHVQNNLRLAEADMRAGSSPNPKSE